MTKVIRSHDPTWRTQFEDEANAVQHALKEAVLGIHHIGSTAIPGLLAKPIIDMLIEARSLDAIDARAQAMTMLGYDARGEYGIEGRRYFSKASPTSAGVGFHVHAFVHGDRSIARHLRFRDYLALHSEAAAAYGALKRSLSDADGVLAPDYTARKAPFVARVERLALADAPYVADRRD